MAGNRRLNVVIADERRLVRDLVTSALETSEEVTVKQACSSAVELLTAVSAHRPDVVLVGPAGLTREPGMLVASVRLACPTSGVVVLVSDENESEMLDAVEAGALGFVTIDHGLGDLVDRVRSAAANETVLPFGLARQIIASARQGGLRSGGRYPQGNGNGQGKGNGNGNGQRGNGSSLTRREQEILGLLSSGMGNAEIARAVGLSANTVKNHLYSIYRKLGVESRGQAIVEATRRGLVTA